MKYVLFIVGFILPYILYSQPFAVVATDAGKISGTSVNGIHVFKGIPFAAPPLGELRWKAPEPVKPWQGVKRCNAFGPSPMQARPVPFGPWTKPYLIRESPISEDCLYLNVWTGAASARERRPVLVWIYGGGFSSGGSSCEIYDGTALAAKGIVFVSFNYRVGIFGFFSHPDLSAESGKNASGNYGLMDQIAALQWVKRNIASFGGDPENVTIAGQSAGSMSVNCLVASPLASGLFTKAIAESGSNLTRTNAVLAEAERVGLQAAGDATLEQLRRTPAEELMKKTLAFRGPVIDGFVLPAQIADLIANGRANNIVLLTGWNQDEGLLFGPPRKADAFRQELERLFGRDAGQAMEYYRADTDEQASRAQLDLSRDQVFGMQNYIWASMQASRGLKAFVYRFSRKVPASGDLARYGAFHTGEVPYAYDNLKYGDRPYEKADHAIARLMASYWVNFIRSGDPNGGDLPSWPAFSVDEKKIMIFDVQSGAAVMPDATQLELLYSKMLRRSQ